MIKVKRATESQLRHLGGLYEGRALYFGDLHNHASTGGTSDGKRPLSHWKGALEALNMDFVGVYDHRQVRHMYLPEWEDGTFICGTEPGTRIIDCDAIDGKNAMHYNLIFQSPAPLEELLTEFSQYEFTGGHEGHFIYPEFERKEFCRLIDAVLEKGGFFVHPHPKQIMQSDDPLQYWFRDKTGIEVFYGDMRNEMTAQNYKLWCDLINMGKRLFACAGQDGHGCASDTALTAIYSTEKSSAGFISRLREGDFVCGSVAMRMCVGDTRMGGKCSFDGKRLCISVDKFHPSVKNAEHRYELVILDGRGEIVRKRISCTEPTAFSFITEKEAEFYRAEIVDISQGLRIAIGNPIWNEKD